MKRLLPVVAAVATQAGVRTDLIRLENVGILGNSYVMMVSDFLGTASL